MHINMNVKESKNNIKCQMGILNKKRITSVPSTAVLSRVRHQSGG